MKDVGKKNENKKTKTVNLRVSIKEYEMIKEKSKKYSSMSSLLLDSVAIFDNKAGRNKIDTINTWAVEFGVYKSELEKIGTNINQFAHYANTLLLQGIENTDVIKSFNVLLDEYNSLYKDMIKLQEAFTKSVIRKW